MPDTPPLLRTVTLEQQSHVAHGFTTRAGGVSEGPLASLNLAARPGEDPARLVENWRRAARAVHASLGPSDVAVLHQVHGARVVRVTAPRGPLEPVAEADAAITDRPGVLLAVRVADCVPVLLAAPGGVGVAHAGWRGVAAGVVGATVAALAELTGAGPEALSAAVGPHVSGEAYEVGPEVVAGLREAGVPDAIFLREGRGERPHVDLGAAVAWQLQAAGVRLLDRTGGCTLRDPTFYSHRRDGASTGRLAGLIARCP